MSYHWDNVIWQSKDGSWNRGYYGRISNVDNPMAWEDPDYYDSEWDDDFDLTRFDFVATGLTQQQAYGYKPRGNPGSVDTIYYKGNSQECKGLDQLAEFTLNPAAREKFEKAEHRRKLREHKRKLAEEWPVEKLKGYLTFSFGRDDRSYDPLGLVEIVSGVVKTEGDWLTVEGRRIFNLKRQSFDSKLKVIQKFSRNYGSYRFGR